MKKFCIFLLTIFFLSVISPCQLRCGLVAQSVEHLTFNQRVMGSNPVGLTSNIKGLRDFSSPFAFYSAN